MKFPEGNPISQGKDFESDHVKLMEDINEDMEDFIVTGRAESILPAAGRL